MKLKLSWQHFIITILIIVILACLVNYLGNNNIIEGLENNNKVDDVKTVYTGKINREPQGDGSVFVKDTQIRPEDAVTNETDGPGAVPNKSQSDFAQHAKDVYKYSIETSHDHNANVKQDHTSIFKDKDPIENEGGLIKVSKDFMASPGIQPKGSATSENEPDPNESNYIGVEGKKEGFANLNGAPISVTGSDDCRNSLLPYKNYSCGPINVDNFFRDIQFKPECCGNPAGSSYSNSMGCACICPEQWTYLNSRGGNRTFPSQF